MWQKCLIHETDKFLLLQPLIPADFDIKHPFVVDHLITTFYATAFKFASMIAKVTHDCYNSTLRLSMKQTRTSIFVAVMHLLLDLHCRFGMILPIAKEMKESCPSIYGLLVPEEEDLNKYSKLRWMKRPDCGKKVEKANNQKGWSNIPFLFWIVGFVMQNDHVQWRVAIEKHPFRQGSKSVNDYLPRITYGKSRITLIQFIEFLLFPYVFDMDAEDKTLVQGVDAVLQNVTKGIVYDDIERSFETDPKYGNAIKTTQTAAVDEPPEDEHTTTEILNQGSQKEQKKKKEQKVILDDSDDDGDEDNEGKQPLEDEKLHADENLLNDLQTGLSFDSDDDDNFGTAMFDDPGRDLLLRIVGFSSGAGSDGADGHDNLKVNTDRTSFSDIVDSVDEEEKQDEAEKEMEEEQVEPEVAVERQDEPEETEKREEKQVEPEVEVERQDEPEDTEKREEKHDEPEETDRKSVV